MAYDDTPSIPFAEKAKQTDELMEKVQKVIEIEETLEEVKGLTASQIVGILENEVGARQQGLVSALIQALAREAAPGFGEAFDEGYQAGYREGYEKAIHLYSVR